MPDPWVFLDIGNVIWSDDEGDRFTMKNILRELLALGRVIESGEIDGVMQQAVDNFSPSLWRSVIWHYTAPDNGAYTRITRQVRADWDALDDERFRAFTQPFPGVPELLADLAAGGLPLALASNNTPRALARLEELELLGHFRVKEVSETLNLAKPDPRFFQALMDRAGCRPEQVVMVGDRLGNDIAPAKLLGMKTLRVLKGWHRKQQARSPADLPDVSVAEPAEIGDALRRLLS